LTPITAAGTLDNTPGVPRLCDLTMADRMDELEFFLRAGSGMECDVENVQDDTQGWVGTDWLGVLAERTNPDVRMSPAYQQKLRNAVTDKSFRGFLNGKIDLVFRWQRRWYIVDYKSNFIARSDLEPQLSAPPPGYSLSAVCAEMEHHHYYLQYHLYVLALHRFLQCRMADYDYDRDMGGVYYLFLRGMTDERFAVTPVAGKSPGVEYGVFYDRPSLAVIERLNAAFLGSTRQEVA
jgi:exodeoxyribonuclease V beta subunit